MLTNEQMKANRYLRWHKARRKVDAIQRHLSAGHIVIVSTPLRAVEYSSKHASMFKATRTGAYVQRGKNWDCIDFCQINVYG